VIAKLWSYIREGAVLLALIAGGMIIQGGYEAEIGCGCSSGIFVAPYLLPMN
jgi:hypothetical protein